MTGALALAVLFVYTGGAMMLGSLEAIDVDMATFFAIALAIAGAGLVVSAFARPARGLLAVGLLLLPISVLFAGADVSWRSGVGERRVNPASAAEMLSEYEHGIGRLVLDLEDLRLNGADRSVAVSLTVGEVVVYVPDDIRWRAQVEIGAGAVTQQVQRQGVQSSRLLDRQPRYQVPYWSARTTIDEGIGVGARVVSAVVDDPAGELDFDIDVGLGTVDIATVLGASQ